MRSEHSDAESITVPTGWGIQPPFPVNPEARLRRIEVYVPGAAPTA